MRPPGALHLGQPVIGMGALLCVQPVVVFGQPVRLHLTGNPEPKDSPYLCVRQRPKKETRPALRLAGFTSL